MTDFVEVFVVAPAIIILSAAFFYLVGVLACAARAAYLGEKE